MCCDEIHVHLLYCFISQLERKRHLGNDIVVIIFVDGENPELTYESCLTFNPSCMKSHFNHIFALVTFDRTKNAYRYIHVYKINVIHDTDFTCVYHYRLVVHSAESVPGFGPSLPARGVFPDPSAFRDFLLTKCQSVPVHSSVAVHPVV